MRKVLQSVPGLVAIGMLAIVLIGCERESQVNVDASNGTATDALPANLILASAPSGATDLKALKATAKEGDTVTVRGVIGGRKDPLASNRAILTIVDPSLETCDKMEGDTCPTPWDACCEDQDTITAGSATVQVSGPDGRPLKAGLNGQGGIAPLKEVIVVGTVRGPVDEKNLTIDATGIYVKS